MARPVVMPDVIDSIPQQQKPPQPGLGVQLQLKASANRIAAVARLSALGGQAIAEINVKAARRVEQETTSMERYDSAVSRLGEEVAQAHKTAKINAAMRQYQIADQSSQAVQEITADLIERFRRMPAGMFYQPTTGERLRAFWHNTYAELEMRPGAPRLTPLQHLKEIVIGGEVDRIVNHYDQQEILAYDQGALARQRAAVPLSAGQDQALASGELPVDEETIQQLMREVLDRQQPQEVE